MKVKINWLKTRLGYTLLGYTDVLQKSELPAEYVNMSGPKYWYVPLAIVEKVAHGDYIAYYSGFHEYKLVVGMVLSPDEWEQVMKIFVEAGEHLADARKMVGAGEEITMLV